MILIPTLQLLDGKCVSLSQGNLDEPSVWHGDPVERALGFVEQGAEWLHVTDLDAVARRGRNSEIMHEIVRRVGVPVQVSGGMTNDESVQEWRDAGAARIIFGSGSINYLDWVKAKAKSVPDYFAVSVDVKGGHVMGRGWTEPSMFTPQDLVTALEGTPLACLVVTDIDFDLELPESSIAMTAKIAEETRTPVISSGLVRKLDDISTLRYIPNIAGAMIGRPLFEKTIDLAEALEIARPEPGRTAEFI